uniref:THIF-type NAD/FAD binding fold domain-containing protein n=1 Tax=Brassica campestris TaxID=3711 RepID=M4E354_BRACM
MESNGKSPVSTGKSPVSTGKSQADEEKHRNIRICDMLFTATSHCLADFIFSLGNHCLQLSDRERIDVKLNFTSDLRFVNQMKYNLLIVSDFMVENRFNRGDRYKDSYNIVEVFEESEGRKHGECSLLDLATVLEIKKKLCEVNSVSESHIPDSLLERLISGTIEFPPACAIVGGILAQEVIKAVSGKGDPVKNFFYYDAQDGKGVMEDISNSFTS